MDKPKDDLDAVRIVVATLETFDKEARERIFRWAAEKLGMHAAAQTTPATTGILPHGPALQRNLTEAIDLKSFVDEKSPNSDMHFAATVAYYYLYEAPQDNRKETINKDILMEAVRVVKWRQGLNNPGQTLLNAFSAGLMDRAGERGEYKLNMVGQNLVAVLLPDGGLTPRPKKSDARRKTSTRTKKAKPKTTGKPGSKK